MTDHWPDGTPIRRGPDPEGPWGAEPAERWVRVLAESHGCLLWDRGGLPHDADELPISAALVARLERWGEWYDREDARFCQRDHHGSDGRTLFYWEDWSEAPRAAFNAEGQAIGAALRAELPEDWTVVVKDL